MLVGSNPLALQENLNRLLPHGCSRFTGIRRSRKGNLICYTVGGPTRAMECLEQWSSGVSFRAIRINAEDKWLRRILYLEIECHSTTILSQELHQSNPGMKLATTPQLLSPTVALLCFTERATVREDIFAFA